MKKFIAILIILVVSLPFIVAHFIKLPQEEKNKSTEIVKDKKEEDLKDFLNSPNYKPKNNDFTIIDEAPPVPPDPFEDLEQETVYSKELVERVRNRRVSPFDKEPMPIIDYKPKKNGEELYEVIGYGEDINVYLPERVGDYMPIKLNFEPNAENFKNIKSFSILSPKGDVVEFNKLVKLKKENDSATIIFQYNDDSRKNIHMSYLERPNNNGGLSFIVEHSKFGSFTGTINGMTKKGYVYSMLPYSPDMNYMIHDGIGNK